jgi:hypothetical protein
LLHNNLRRLQRDSVWGQTRLRRWDRVFWSWLSRFWKRWPSCLVLVKPETVIGWQRQGFKLYWRWKCWKGKKLGRPPIDEEIPECGIDNAANRNQNRITSGCRRGVSVATTKVKTA